MLILTEKYGPHSLSGNQRRTLQKTTTNSNEEFWGPVPMDTSAKTGPTLNGKLTLQKRVQRAYKSQSIREFAVRLYFLKSLKL